MEDLFDAITWTALEVSHNTIQYSPQLPCEAIPATSYK